MKSETVVLLTGGSSGIGQCTARYLAEAGCRVYELSRRDSSQPGIIHLTCDVTREEQVQAAVKTVAEREGRIDIVVNNAGFGISGAVEFADGGRTAAFGREFLWYGPGEPGGAALYA